MPEPGLCSGWGRAEPSRAGPSRAEPDRAGRAEPGRAEAEPSLFEPSRFTPSRVGRAGPNRAELQTPICFPPEMLLILRQNLRFLQRITLVLDSNWRRMKNHFRAGAAPGWGQSRAELGRAEPNWIGPGGAEPGRTEPNRACPVGAGLGHAELGWARLGRAGLSSGHLQTAFFHRLLTLLYIVSKRHQIGTPHMSEDSCNRQNIMKHRQHSGTPTQEHSAAQRDHEWLVEIQKAPTFDRDRRPDGRMDPHKSLRPTLATEESSRARSFARSHARNANASAVEIDFPVRG